MPDQKPTAKKQLHWEKIECVANGDTPISRTVYRSKVPGGWLVQVVFGAYSGTGTGLAFYPDPGHEWDGNSLA